jgi:hypothetical protein
MSRSYSKAGNRVRSDAPFPFKNRGDVEDAESAERGRLVNEIHKNTPYDKDPAAFQAALNKMDAELTAKYKPIYKQELANRKAAKAEEANAKAQEKAAKDDEKKRVGGISSGIVRGLAPQRTALIDRLIEYRKSDYENMKRTLEGAKGDIEKLFSGPKKWDNIATFKARNKDSLEAYYVDEAGNAVPERIYGASVRYRLKAEPNTSTWHGDARQQADAIVDEFAAKIVAKTEEQAKIGNSSDEKIIGTPKVESSLDPWQNSRITVETTHRVVTWETNMILNRSKLNTVFNQWPTRLVSDTKK